MYDSYYYDTYSRSGSEGSGIYYLIYIAVIVLLLASYWQMFKKAGRPGWAAIVPFYNAYVLSDIAMGSGWLFLLSFIPVVNVVYSAILCYKLGQAYGRSTAFSVGLIFLAPIFMPILAFSSNSYYCGPSPSTSGTYIAGGKVPSGYGDNYYRNVNNSNYSTDQFYGQTNSNPYAGNMYSGQKGSNLYGDAQYYGQNNSNSFDNNAYYGQNANPYDNSQSNAGSYGNEQYFGQNNVGGNDQYYGQGGNNQF